MKDNKKKILAAAAFLIAAGLLFGMTKKEKRSEEISAGQRGVPCRTEQREPWRSCGPSAFQKFETAEKPQDAAHGSRKLEKL